jgi:hypothetical protein
MPDEIWAITSYFNPLHWRRRSANYRIFRQHLPFPLIAVELGFGDGFDLNSDDAEMLLKLTGGDVMWQKERLLNLALEALPESCSTVVWIDCDVIFQRTDMAQQISRQIEHAPLVQLFSLVHDLEPDISLTDWRPLATPPPRHSIPFRLAQGMTAADCLGKRHPGELGIRSPGHAWAIRKELIAAHGFYDYGIVGGGDEALACAAYGVFDEVIRLEYMNPQQTQRYLAWAEPFHESVSGNVSLIEGDLLHLWHGNRPNRRFYERHSGLAPYHFDPYSDIARSDSGCWRWNTDKPALHDYVRDYFSARQEDETVPEIALT